MNARIKYCLGAKASLLNPTFYTLFNFNVFSFLTVICHHFLFSSLSFDVQF